MFVWDWQDKSAWVSHSNLDCFWGEIVGCAHESVRQSSLRIYRSAETKIPKLDDPASGAEDVAWLYIPVQSVLSSRCKGCVRYRSLLRPNSCDGSAMPT